MQSDEMNIQENTMFDMRKCGAILSALRAARGDELGHYETELAQWNADRKRSDALAQYADEWERNAQRYADEWERDAQRYADRRSDDERADALALAKLAAQYGDLSGLEALGGTTAAQTRSALREGVRTQKVLDAYEYWYGAPYDGGSGDAADAPGEIADSTPELPRFTLPRMSEQYGGSTGAGTTNTGLTTAAYNMAGRGIIELWDAGDEANRQKARDQLAAVWPSLSTEQKRNMRTVLALHGMKISA